MVTRDTPWPPGTPCWAEVSVDDVPRAAAFYQELFGWDPGQPSVWLTYLATGDADATAAGIAAAGGSVLQPPADIMEQGRMAVAMDTAGAVFGLWQAGLTMGIGVANEPGALSWSEQLSGDYAGSKAFYQAVFGYQYQDIGQTYAMLMVGGREVGGIGQRQDNCPVCPFRVSRAGG